jgi:hypothetical protein
MQLNQQLRDRCREQQRLAGRANQRRDQRGIARIITSKDPNCDIGAFEH